MNGPISFLFFCHPRRMWNGFGTRVSVKWVRSFGVWLTFDPFKTGINDIYIVHELCANQGRQRTKQSRARLHIICVGISQELLTKSRELFRRIRTVRERGYKLLPIISALSHRLASLRIRGVTENSATSLSTRGSKICTFFIFLDCYNHHSIAMFISQIGFGSVKLNKKKFGFFFFFFSYYVNVSSFA